MGRGRARRRGRAARLRHPGRPQPRDLRRPPSPGPDRPRARAARAGRRVHGGRLRARVGAPRRRRGDDGAGRDQRADAARRGPRGLPARAPRDVGRPQRAGRAGHGRAPRGAEPDRVLPAGQPVGRRPPERRGDSRRGPGRVPPLPDRPARPGHAVDPDRSPQRARRGAAHAGRRGPAPAVRRRTGGGGGPLPRPGPAAAPRRGRRRDRGGRDGRAPGPRAPAAGAGDHVRDGARRDLRGRPALARRPAEPAGHEGRAGSGGRDPRRGLPVLPPLDQGPPPQSRVPPRPGADPDRPRPAHDRPHARAGAGDRRRRAGRPRGDPRGPAAGAPPAAAWDWAALRRARDARSPRYTATVDRLLRALREALPADGIVVGDQTGLNYWMEWHLPILAPRTFLYPIGSATLGYGVPAAIGAKVAHPDRAVVAVVGDGGLLFTAAELATAAKYRLPSRLRRDERPGLRGDPVSPDAALRPDGRARPRRPGRRRARAGVRGGGLPRARPRDVPGGPRQGARARRAPRSSRCRSPSSRRGISSSRHHARPGRPPQRRRSRRPSRSGGGRPFCAFVPLISRSPCDLSLTSASACRSRRP